MLTIVTDNTQTYTETDKPIAIGEILLICQKIHAFYVKMLSFANIFNFIDPGAHIFQKMHFVLIWLICPIDGSVI